MPPVLTLNAELGHPSVFGDSLRSYCDPDERYPSRHPSDPTPQELWRVGRLGLAIYLLSVETLGRQSWIPISLPGYLIVDEPDLFPSGEERPSR